MNTNATNLLRRLFKNYMYIYLVPTLKFCASSSRALERAVILVCRVLRVKSRFWRCDFTVCRWCSTPEKVTLNVYVDINSLQGFLYPS